MNTLVRLPQWEEALSLYLDRQRDERFVWGQLDCALFAAGAILSQTGVDVADKFREQYSDLKSSAEALRVIGQGTLLRTVTELLGEPLHAAQARRGDIVMKGRTALGVCVGRYSWFVGEEEGREGLVSWPTLDLSRCWRIG